MIRFGGVALQAPGSLSRTVGESKLGALLIVALLVSGCSSPAPTAPGTAEQACAEPRTTVTPQTVAPGESVTVEGAGWEACNDTPNNGAPSAWGEIDLAWAQGDVVDRLGEVTAADGTFQLVATVPIDARPGRASVRITAPGYSTEVPVSVTDD